MGVITSQHSCCTSQPIGRSWRSTPFGQAYNPGMISPHRQGWRGHGGLQQRDAGGTQQHASPRHAESSSLVCLVAGGVCHGEAEGVGALHAHACRAAEPANGFRCATASALQLRSNTHLPWLRLAALRGCADPDGHWPPVQLATASATASRGCRARREASGLHRVKTLEM